MDSPQPDVAAPAERPARDNDAVRHCFRYASVALSHWTRRLCRGAHVAMTYVIGAPCIDVTDRACIETCPVDCIYEGSRKLYINPSECIDCGACEPVCPVEAIAHDLSVPAEQEGHIADNANFFSAVLPGRTEPVGSPGGSHLVGPIGIDTPLVTAHAAR